MWPKKKRSKIVLEQERKKTEKLYLTRFYIQESRLNGAQPKISIDPRIPNCKVVRFV